MIRLTSGNILEAPTDAIVNTVNCEGYMGKGIAYQFKLEYPKNFESYALSCKKGELRPGNLHIFSESGKLIVNFPTKDKWRAKSKYEFIESGLRTLKVEIENRHMKSISIPPLGCGNGGLDWNKVKDLIIFHLEDLKETEVFIYEPSTNYRSQPKREPSLSLSHYLIMEIKPHLKKFSRFRLQKTAFLMDFFNSTNYFKFEPHLYGPYSHSLDIVTKEILEYQTYHKSDTSDAKKMLEKKLQSENFYRSLKSQEKSLEAAANLVNRTENDRELELITSILFLVHSKENTNQEEIVENLACWSERKNKLFNRDMIEEKIRHLEDRKILTVDVLNNVKKHSR